jgi:hypothetical protein
MEAHERNLGETVCELYGVPDPFREEVFPHLMAEVRDLARELRGPHTPQGERRQVRVARVVDGLQRVEWAPKSTDLSRQTGMKVSTVFDHVTKLRKLGMPAHMTLYVPGARPCSFSRTDPGR